MSAEPDVPGLSSATLTRRSVIHRIVALALAWATSQISPAWATRYLSVLLGPLLLVGAAGLSYDEAAAICRCPAGTIKSRANRGRMRLAELLCIDGAADLGPDKTTQAALSGGNLHWMA